MPRQMTRSALTLSLLLITASSAFAASPPAKEYVFAELVFESEVKEPGVQRFEDEGRARFGRLSDMAPISFLGALLESSGESSLRAWMRTDPSLGAPGAALEPSSLDGGTCRMGPCISSLSTPSILRTARWCPR